MASSKPSATSNVAKGVANNLLLDFYRTIAYDKPACYFISNVTTDPSDQSDNGKSFDFMVVLDSMPGYAFDMSFMFKLASRRAELRKGMAYLYEQFVKQIVLFKKDAFLREYPAKDVYELSIDVDLEFRVSRRLYACNRVCRQMAQGGHGGAAAAAAASSAVHDGLEHIHDVLLSISPEWYFGDYVGSCRARGAKPILPQAVYLEFFRMLDPPAGQDYIVWPVEILRFLHDCCPAQLVNGRGVSPTDGKNVALVSLLDLITNTATGQHSGTSATTPRPAVPWGKLVMVSEEQCEGIGALLPPNPPASRAGAPYISRQVYVPALVALRNTAQYGVALVGAGGARLGPSATAGMPRGGPSARTLQKGPPGGLVRTSLSLPPQPRRSPLSSSSSASAWPPPRHATAGAAAGAEEEDSGAHSGLQDLFAAYRTSEGEEAEGPGGSAEGGKRPSRPSAGKRKRQDSSASEGGEEGAIISLLGGEEGDGQEESSDVTTSVAEGVKGGGKGGRGGKGAGKGAPAESRAATGSGVGRKAPGMPQAAPASLEDVSPPSAGPVVPSDRDKTDAEKALAALVADTGKIGKGKMMEILAENIAYKRQAAELGGQLRRAKSAASAAQLASAAGAAASASKAEGAVDAQTREKITQEAVRLAWAAHGQCVPLSTAEALRRKAAELEASLQQERVKLQNTEALLIIRSAAAASAQIQSSAVTAAAAATAAAT